jgi:hypothetical protein
MSRLQPFPHAPQPQLQIPQDAPAYQLKSACFLDDTLYPEDFALTWPDEPSLEMTPLNELAREAMAKYIAKLDACGKAAADKLGKHYNSLADAMDNARAIEVQESKKVGIITGKKQVPLMKGNKKNRVEKVEAGHAAPLVGSEKSK